MTSQKVTCAKCGLFCGFLIIEGSKIKPPAFPDACPNKDGGTWAYSSEKCIENCPVAQLIECHVPNSLRNLKIPPRGPLQAGRDPHAGVEKDPDAYARADQD